MECSFEEYLAIRKYHQISNMKSWSKQSYRLSDYRIKGLQDTADPLPTVGQLPPVAARWGGDPASLGRRPLVASLTQLRAALSLTHKHGSCVRAPRQVEGAPQGTHQEVSDQGCQDRRLGCCQGKSQEGLRENESEPEYKKEERTVCNLMNNKQCLD